MNNKTREKGFLYRFINFNRKAFDPVLHFNYTVFWFLSLECLLILAGNSTSPWIINLKLFLGILSVFIMLFFFRAIDEIKDYEYDKEFNKSRPLVTGEVTRRELYIYIISVVLIIITINLYLSRVLLIIMLTDIFYSLILVLVEKRSDKLKNSLFLNLLITFPVNIILSVYICFFFFINYQVAPDVMAIGPLFAFVIAYLNYEFSRKTFWPHQIISAEQRSYSGIIGVSGSLLLIILCGLIPVIVAFFIIKPWQVNQITDLIKWIILFPYVPLSLGLIRFVKLKSADSKPIKLGIMTGYASIYLTSFFITLIIILIFINKVIFKW